MPERWEHELRKLREVDPNENTIRERAGRVPSSDRLPPRRNALIAGIVAGAVAIAGVVFLGQLDESGRQLGGGADVLPTLVVTFASNGTIGETPSDADPIRRVDTKVVYGDASEEDFTSTTPVDAHVDWVGADDLTRFVPGPTAGSPVRIEADGENARVLIGKPADWPEFERFAPIEELPQEPGDYVLIFEADYPEGVARTARFVSMVSPGVLQLVVTEGKSLYAATALAFLDGASTDGFLSSSGFTLGDVDSESEPAAPNFEPDAWLEVPAGSPMLLVSTVSKARAGVFERYEDFTPDAPLASDLVADAPVLEGSSGRHLLAVDVIWRQGPHPLRDEPTEERALFFFPIEVVPVIAGVQSPTPGMSPTPAPVGEGAVVIDIRRSSEETSDPEATARFEDQEVWMCPDHWTVVNPDGTEEKVLFDCGQTDVFQAPVGTPIEVTGDFETIDVTAVGQEDRTHYAPNQVPGLDPGSIVTFTFNVEWADGSEASFWLLLTVAEGSPTEEASVLEVRCGPDGAEILTRVVVAQPDGVHIEVDNAAGAESLEFRAAVSPDGLFGGPIDGMVRAWPIDPGEYFVECLDGLAETHEGLERARFEVVDPNGYWVPGTPECRGEDPLMKVNSYERGGADYGDDETTIRALLHAIEPTDEVRLPFYPEGGGAKDLRYVVVRDERVIATLYVGVSDERDPQGPGLPEVTGQACASSGIAQGSIG